MSNKVIIQEFPYNQTGLQQLRDNAQKDGHDNRYLYQYPTVYIINDKSKNGKNQYAVYIGETNNIAKRTTQHLIDDPKSRNDWNSLSKSKNAQIYVIAHKHFNKSLTLDIENQLMLHLGTVDNVIKIYNRRTNQQGEYYPVEELDSIFNAIWTKLHRKNKELFPALSTIRDLAIFKSSPFHKLKQEQLIARNVVMEKIDTALENEETGQLIMITGEAGSGKTVLLSSIFNDLLQDDRNIDVHLMVNHDEQVKVYQTIAKKLSFDSSRVTKPTVFINNASHPVDVVLVDEAHLLWTQGKQSYRGKNQLQDLLKLARVVVIIFDKNQILRTQQILEADDITKLENQARKNDNLIELKNQMRIDADKHTINWIRSIVDKQTVGTLKTNSTRYEVKIFDTPQALESAIRLKNKQDADSNYANGISRIIATFDWKFSSASKPKDDELWMVKIDDWKLPWNNQIKHKKHHNINYKDLSWAEKPETINEVGSTYTVQGFDLNYAGVIIGPSVKYRDGHIVFDKNEHANKDANQKRTLADGSKQSFAEELIKNELNVLLTRGVHGLYIYAVDPELRAVLKKAVQN